MGIDAIRLREVFASFPSGVVAVCALRDGRPLGMAASTFTAVSLDPPLVSVCIQRSSQTWPLLRESTRLGVTILAEQHGAACRTLSMKEGDRFSGVDFDVHDDGSVVLRGASGWLTTTLHAEIDAGDHVVALLRVQALDTDPASAPLVFHRSGFHRLVPAGGSSS
ncbi:flavin reductase family protein [Gordonia sp. zg691]|uniref:Flavin reductase family protein n=1 Tax=Gordonia jinghuaiqii TaxID=2758710 RepID=A0A7D7LX63_9ACTN|nr:flavin reductase family protein [Gordonia jinghuaiqii]MBD0863839.1 flavin reductase family protein [Gordonia jinghuaiqii]MCR5979939.1 oxidoreductase [Gordonia jinghuaiqii]QMT03801.1 flavin reductase family protein [Gordonia jinghuaiqii]